MHCCGQCEGIEAEGVIKPIAVQRCSFDDGRGQVFKALYKDADIPFSWEDSLGVFPVIIRASVLEGNISNSSFLKVARGLD